jgi:putative tryptophan/tyrosine transport system substrate-binding protein
VAIGASPWLVEAARQAMPTTPIVTVFAEDPVETGLVASLARPGGTITGVTGSTAPEITGKRLQLLKELAPGISRVAVLGTTKAWTLYRDRADGAQEDDMLFIPLERPEQLEGALASVLREGADGLVVQAGATAYVHAQRIVDFAAANRLPAIYTFREPVEAGGLISYGINVERLLDSWQDSPTAFSGAPIRRKPRSSSQHGSKRWSMSRRREISASPFRNRFCWLPTR